MLLYMGFSPCPSTLYNITEMPVLDGLAATREIRSLEALQNAKPIPIIALTAAAMNGDRQECLAAGCTDYLSKPLEPEKLHRMLSRFL